MTPAELARIERLWHLRATQLRLAEAVHAKARAVEEGARVAEQHAFAAVDAAAEAAAHDGGGEQVVDDLVESRLRVAFLSHLAARRSKEAALAGSARQATAEKVKASNLTSEQMRTWFDGAVGELRMLEERKEELVRDELVARRAATKESP